jgi:hypothetical protein
MLQRDPGLAARSPVRYILKWGGERYSPRCARTIEESTDTDQSTDQQRLDPSPRRLLSSAEGVTHPQTPAITSTEFGVIGGC